MKREMLIRILIGVSLLTAALIVSAFSSAVSLILYIAAFLVCGYDVIIDAFRNVLSFELLDENFLMSIAAVGAFFVGEYPEAVAVMLLFQVGEAFQSYAVGKSRKSIRALMDIRPDTANLIKDGEAETVSPEEVHPGDLILIKPGERVPLDCVIVAGQTALDTSALTGESMPLDAFVGDTLLSGSINLTGAVTCRTEKEFDQSTASRILELVENASGKKSRSENFITAFSHWYTPFVVACAALLAVIPPIFIKDTVFSDWLYRALTFLVISCPCALVISVPMSFFAALGNASRRGILIKGSNYLEALSKAESVVFDKTGTLTKGIFRAEKVHAEGISESELLRLAAHAESFSRHPIAVSIVNAYEGSIDAGAISSVSELSGFGVVATVDGKEIVLGNDRLLSSMNIPFPETDFAGTCVYAAVNGTFAGYILVSDEVKETTLPAVKELKSLGIKHLTMLTGDKEKIGRKVAAELGLDGAETDLLPGDKVQRLEFLLEKTSSGKKLVYVGDGMNDAPVLARADIGIAMGSLGSDAAIEAADIVIMTDELTKIPEAIRLSVKTRAIVMQNIVFSLSVKFLVLFLGAIGFASMWAAVFADVGVAFIAILNAMRLLKSKT